MSFRIQSLHLKNYGNLPEFHCEKFTGLNLIIGENATGKTFLLKSLYSAVRAMEDYKRGDDITRWWISFRISCAGPFRQINWAT